jgi:hypothetical protein
VAWRAVPPGNSSDAGQGFFGADLLELPGDLFSTQRRMMAVGTAVIAASGPHTAVPTIRRRHRDRRACAILRAKRDRALTVKASRRRRDVQALHRPYEPHVLAHYRVRCFRIYLQTELMTAILWCYAIGDLRCADSLGQGDETMTSEARLHGPWFLHPEPRTS